MSVWKSDETLLSICILNFSFKNDFVWEEISNIRHSVSSPDETPRSSSKILRCASYFQLSSRCFIWWRNTASHVWYITWHINKLKWWDRAVLQWYGHLLLILSQRFGLGLGGYPYYCDSGSIANWVVWTSENSLGRKTYWIERGKSAFCVFYVYMKQRDFENPIKLQRRWPQLVKTWIVQTTR